MGDDSNFISEESDNNIFNRSDNAAVANSDVEIIDVNKFKNWNGYIKNVCYRTALYHKTISW